MSANTALIVDDQAGIRALLREFMAGLGISSEEAQNGHEALEMLEHLKPDIVLLDVKMPGISGVDTLREMRRRNISIPVVILTAYQDIDVHSAAGELGTVARLNKPFDLAELEVIIAECLGRTDL